MYNYKEAVKEDILAYIHENGISVENIAYNKERLLDDLWIADEVTGNASGSYYCNAWKAEEALCHNLDLLEEALLEFGGDVGEAIRRGSEYCDVTIRCYLLHEALNEVIDEIEEEE